MRFTSNVKVTGMKASKGQMENGTSFDSTKVYTETPLDDSKGTAKGFAVAEFTLGTSAEFDKYKHLPFPFEAAADLELVTNGKTQKTVMHSLKPVEMSRPAKAG
ncbi:MULTISPECIES: hypothetical protein [Burkholderiaceae]|uniref:Uncharacterized protein n=2 Tax=Burkholderiaceae TaxID=119060 RepID=A0A3N8QE54_9BURK|nr:MULTISPECIES: hypothetical protein [Burkholderiaceae]KGW49678.1 hypothetical protein Y049_2733 [Burkholderia pseudomallei MSHR684]MDP9648623.1 hypothetical protein [Paraburkholderia caledonica]MBB5507141.1 hypothetical protein [Paraburkholderia atlantica]MCA8078988.1 hypothetical protein [Burkholderia cepacia]MCW5134607.1 hypothetical protein [Burkholderia cenocepacia]